MSKTLGKKAGYSKRDLKAYYYIAPWLIGFAILQLYPFISSLIYSFADYSIGSKPDFIGFGNYIKLFTKDKEFWTSLRVTIVFALMTVPGKIILALAVAIFLNRDIRGINLIRTLYYIPSLFGGSVAIAILWKLMFLDNGPINAVLTALRLPNVQFLGSTTWALPTICLLEIWQFGSSMVMFLAALKNVPKSLYEAAEIRKNEEILAYNFASDFTNHFLYSIKSDNTGTAKLYLRRCNNRGWSFEVNVCFRYEAV